MSSRDDIDRLLRESGERWRSNPLPVPEIDETTFADRPGFSPSARATRGLSTSAAVALLVLVAVLALVPMVSDSLGPSAGVSPTAPAFSSPSTTETSAASTPIATTTAASPIPAESNVPAAALPALVREGDAVVAYGNLLETATPSEVLMCRDAGGWAPDIGCLGNVIVTVRGVEVRDLPGIEGDPAAPDLPAGTWVSYYVRVEGVWQGQVIEATRVELAERPSTRELLALPDVPCLPPPGGWPADAGDPDAIRQAQTLHSEVSMHPDQYAGLSYAVTSHPDGRIGELVAVVGTLVDVESVAPKLRAIYPFNLCIVKVEHRSSDLQVIADDLAALDLGWEILIDPAAGRVGVHVPVFDQAAAAALAPYSGIVLIRSLVARFAD